MHQFSPVDTPAAVDAFLNYWNPNALVILENELWPNLILSSSKKGIKVVLLNARVSSKSFVLWSSGILRHLVSLMLSRFTLIVPLCNKQAIRLQLLDASPFNINFAGDLKYAVVHPSQGSFSNKMNDLRQNLANRRVWLASSIHEGEEEVIIGVHDMLVQRYPNLVTIIVPRYPETGRKIAKELQRTGSRVALSSHHQKITQETSVYVVDTLGELKNMYLLSPIAVVGGSFCPNLNGHNISEAAAAGCAVITGRHVGHFSHMVREMQHANPLSVLQVAGKVELNDSIVGLLDDVDALLLRRSAATHAFHVLSCHVIRNTWKLLDFHIFRHVC